MSVIRTKKDREKPFVILDTTALNDTRLSFRAKGLHTYLMAKPDDWQVQIEQLEKQSPREARDAIRVAMQELETAGYLRRVRIRGTHGRMQGWDTTVYETPTLALLAGEDAALIDDTIGLEIDDAPTTDNPTSVYTPTTDSPKSANPKSVKPSLLADSPMTDNPLSVPPKTDSPKSANPQLLSIEKETKETTPPTPHTRATSFGTDDLMGLWNELAPPVGLPRKLKLSNSLRAKIQARLREHREYDWWRTVIENLITIPWFLGENDRQWVADLDYLVKNDTNAQRIYERPRSKPKSQRRSGGLVE